LDAPYFHDIFRLPPLASTGLVGGVFCCDELPPYKIDNAPYDLRLVDRGKVMLLDQKDVLKLLRCPKSGCPLKSIGNKLIAESGEDRVDYEIIKDHPILIDFDKSIIRKESIKTLCSPLQRHSYTGLLGVFKRLVSPPNSTTAENVRHIMDLLFDSNEMARVLIIGGATIGQNMEPFYTDPRVELVSFDIYFSPYVQFIADAHNIPLLDNGFDAVIIQATLEHVLEPIKVVSEIYRVLDDDGIVYAETPFLQHVHEGAYDFTRFTESGHRYLFNRFMLIKSGASAGAGTQLLWSLDNFFRGLFRSRKLGKGMKLCFFWLQHCDRLIPDSFNIDAASGVFFLGKKNTSPINPSEIVTHYKGAQR
jgi:hypothetical protein